MIPLAPLSPERALTNAARVRFLSSFDASVIRLLRRDGRRHERGRGQPTADTVPAPRLTRAVAWLDTAHAPLSWWPPEPQ